MKKKVWKDISDRNIKGLPDYSVNENKRIHDLKNSVKFQNTKDNQRILKTHGVGKKKSYL